MGAGALAVRGPNHRVRTVVQKVARGGRANVGPRVPPGREQLVADEIGRHHGVMVIDANGEGRTLVAEHAALRRHDRQAGIEIGTLVEERHCRAGDGRRTGPKDQHGCENRSKHGNGKERFQNGLLSCRFDEGEYLQKRLYHHFPDVQ